KPLWIVAKFPVGRLWTEFSACTVCATRHACEQPEALVRRREVPKLARKSPSSMGKALPAAPGEHPHRNKERWLTKGSPSLHASRCASAATLRRTARCYGRSPTLSRIS